jgi:hypothetical protein
MNPLLHAGKDVAETDGGATGSVAIKFGLEDAMDRTVRLFREPCWDTTHADGHRFTSTVGNDYTNRRALHGTRLGSEAAWSKPPVRKRDREGRPIQVEGNAEHGPIR